MRNKSLQKPMLLNRRLRLILAWVLALSTIMLNSGVASAATLSSASVVLSDPRPVNGAIGTNVNYSFTASSVTSGTIKCIKEVYSTSPTTTGVPTGFVSTGATITAASSTYVNSSASGWSLSAGTNGTLLYTNSIGITPSTLSGATFIAAGITNSSVPDTKYFLQFSTYNNIDCSTAPVDNVTVTFINTTGQTLSLTVDPTMSFTVNTVGASQSCNGTTTTQASTSTTIPFGTVTTSANSIVCQDLIVATNAGNGYTVYIRYTGKPQSGANLIADHTGSNAAPTVFPAAGTEAYGYTTEDATLQAVSVNRFISNKWAANTTTNAEAVYNSAPVTTETTRVGHQVGIAGTTKPGTYTTTVIYTCTPVY